MAALRSALAMLSRGSSGSSSIAYLGGRGLEINQVFRHAAPPILPAAAIRNLGYRCFSTGVREPAGAIGVSQLHMWWQRARNRVKNAALDELSRGLLVYTLVVLGTPAVYVVKSAPTLDDEE